MALPDSSTLTDAPIMAFVPTLKPDQARAFYESVLGLRLTAEDNFAMTFDVGGTMLRLVRVNELQPASFTVLGWQVADIQSAMAELTSRGVRFERFSFMQQDPHAIWTAPDGTRVAWFKDPDGNTLSLTQF